MDETVAPDSAPQKVGRFRVNTELARVEGFAAAVALPGAAPIAGGHVPATFPAYWMTLPEIRQALTDAVATYGAGTDTILVHLGQSIDYHQTLAVDGEYWVDLELKPDAEKRLKLEASIIDDDGAIVALLVGSFYMADIKPAGIEARAP